MDLTQKKLSKAEWEAIEVPLPASDKEILQLVKNGYNNVNIKQNNALIYYLESYIMSNENISLMA